MWNELFDEKVNLSTRVRNTTTMVPIHPKPIDEDFDQYANINLVNILASTTGFPTNWDPTLHDQINKMKNLLEQEKQEQREKRHNKYLQRLASKSPRKKESNEDQEIVNARFKAKLERITKHLPPEDYYKNSPIKPGFGFLESLIHGRRNINKLKVNIPESYYAADRAYLLYTDEAGCANCETSFKVYDFMKKVLSHRVQSDNEMDQAAAVFRARGDLWMKSSVLMWDQFRSRIESHEQLQSVLLQRYIRTSGDRPSITRIFFSSFKKDHRANLGVAIINDVNEMEYLSPYKRFIIDTKLPNTWDIVNVTGHALRPYEVEAKKIARFLEKSYDLRLEKIVLDFIRDQSGKIWLCNCKGFKIDITSLNKQELIFFDKFARHSLSSPKFSTPASIKDAKAKSMSKVEEIVYYAHCKSCKLNYAQSDLNHLVSERMIVIFKEHIESRRNAPFDTLNANVANFETLSQSVRVCDYCFTLISSELELIKVEKELAKTMNIPIDKSFTSDPDLQFLPQTLNQWRILIYFDKLEMVTDTYKDLHLSIKFHNSITVFPLENLSGFQILKIPHMKLYYLYLSADKSPRAFFKHFQIEIRITRDRSWESKIAYSKSFLFFELPFYLSPNQAMSSQKRLFLYGENSNILGEISLVIGVSNDHKIKTKYFKVGLEKILDVYLPDENHYRCDPLPEQWMEMLGNKNDESSTFGNKSGEYNYTPHLNKNEMKRMESEVPLETDRKSSTMSRRSSIFMPIEEPEREIIPKLQLAKMRKSKKKQKKLSKDVDQYLNRRGTCNSIKSKETSNELKKWGSTGDIKEEKQISKKTSMKPLNKIFRTTCSKMLSV
ncbi:unnamed protein product [Blepharisma stoltei]|uniref:Uncharacterized protein n=1 Tax=Blepharisma stoltei TaxID=1481888 RepID=A0AAU9IX53_9CILI|nr:unnamed protein product [Blepharisma stoltei]